MTIYYISRDENEPAGGRMVAYQHVDILNQAGIPAAILHNQKPFRNNWFDNSTVVKWESDGTIPTDKDILVYPETLGYDMQIKHPGVPRVAFVQGAEMMFTYDDDGKYPPPYDQVLGVMVPSEWAYLGVTVVFPEAKTKRIYNAVRDCKWTENKKKIIACDLRKGERILHKLIYITRARGKLNGWTIEDINGNRNHALEILSSAAIFITPSINEGFGLLPLEAGAMGCAVVGYTGYGGKEYWGECGFIEIPTADMFSLAIGLEVAVQQNLRTSKEAADWIQRVYSVERQRKSVLAFWHDILGVRVETKKTSILLPSIGRAKQLTEVIGKIKETTQGNDVEIVVVTDDWDIETIEAMGGMDVRLEIMPGGSGPVAAWNHALKVSTGEWLVLGADDLVFNPGWYEEMARGFEQGGFVALTYYPNNTIIHDWATHFGMTREYIKKWNGGCMLTPHYHHQWIDPEASARAQYAGEYVEGVQIIEHKHPAYGTAEIDDTYRQGCYKWGTPDGEVFRRRQRQGFPDDFEAII